MFKSGKQWPIFIAVAIFGVVMLGYWTIRETFKADITESNLYMSRYQNVDENINDILEANIAFDKKYELKLVDFDLKDANARLDYLLVKKDGTPVNDAKFDLIISRPVNDAKDIKLSPTKIQNGHYIYENIHLPKKGRWDLLLKVKAGEETRFYNLKTDTRKKKIIEF
ncbi:hypothetical protein MNB_SM-7-717 [hydrothermal vent metagenome]|uniref:YtkA-like domain-containing protein n=1 Tax=hydrothermal vent metagenome TaxID=652676 RepID=A0A1W1C376_9ZZZZ